MIPLAGAHITTTPTHPDTFFLRGILYLGCLCAFASQGGWPQAISSQTRGFGGAERQAGRHREKLGRLVFVFGKMWIPLFFAKRGDSAAFRWQEFSV